MVLPELFKNKIHFNLYPSTCNIPCYHSSKLHYDHIIAKLFGQIRSKKKKRKEQSTGITAVFRMIWVCRRGGHSLIFILGAIYYMEHCPNKDLRGPAYIPVFFFFITISLYIEHNYLSQLLTNRTR